jgi:hypothetical protein
MEKVDKVTLELLMNKNTYSRYIEKTDPNKYKEEQQFREKIQKYKSKMISLTIKHLDDPYFQVNNELSSMISEYARTFIKYFEMNDLEISCFYNNEKQDQEDTLFGNMDSTHSDDETIDDNDYSSVVADDGSITTTDKANKLLYKYTMDKYVKRV